MVSENADCGIHNACERVVPTSLILLDNVPTLFMFLLGAILLGIVWWPLAIPMLLYDFAAIVMFWGRICPYCQHFETRACPCGYGIIAPKYFKRKEGKNFREVFRKNIIIMFPCWFLPLGAGIYLLYYHYSFQILIIFLAFALVAFILIPAISKFVGCKGCDLKEQCPWMS